MVSENAAQSTPFVTLAEKDALEELFQRSQTQPVVLFKHSLTCPISAAAYQQMQQLKGEVALLVVQQARDLSQEVAQRTGIRHESPQAIILRNGEAVWHASHWRITSAEVERAVHEFS